MNIGIYMPAPPIVAIGFSAGGLEAITEFLEAVQQGGSELAWVVIAHLDPSRESLLPEILAGKTSLRVAAVRDGDVVEAGRIYVIPPNATLTVSAGRIRLALRPPGRHMPVDIFFASLAQECADRAIAVVLSGADSDGSRGIVAIKDNGGFTLAQEPSTAQVSGMPVSAIETGCVDFVGRPAELAREILRLRRHSYMLDGATRSPEDRAAPAPDEEALRRIFRRLRAAHGVDFSLYKPSTIGRRLARRMALQRIEHVGDYVALVESDPVEALALHQDFLIRVTAFFRDPESFNGLAARVFPNICEGRSPKDRIRIWVPGCASGEEVYSIAMALFEYAGDGLASSGVQIFGSDVSEAAIERARAASYPDNIEQEVSAERLSRFFVKQDHQYRIAKSLRDVCIFARQDITIDPPFSRLDLVSCRNLLIYLDATAQRRIMQVFHYALRPQGFLVLGPSESIGAVSDLFDLVAKDSRIYRRKRVGSAASVDPGTRAAYPGGRSPADREPSVSVEADSAQREADRLLLARYAPPSLLVDETQNILQYRGATGRYLEPAGGAPSVSLQRNLRPELLIEIAPAIAEAQSSGTTVRREGLRVDSSQHVSVEVVPLKSANAQRCYLLVFEDESVPSLGRGDAQSVRQLPEPEKDRRLRQLEREVAATRDYLQATLEEHEAVKEELKSANEEVLSANEEYQSTNEELETAKEELQSANEELTTTNEELRTRNRDLSVLNAEVDKARRISERARLYADMIVETMREPLLVLDAELNVLRANRVFYERFLLTAGETEGCPLVDLGTGQFTNSDLHARLQSLAQTGDSVENYQLHYNVPGRGLRTLCINARPLPGDKDRVSLILMGIEDATERIENSERLLSANQRKDEFLAMLAHELRNPLSPILHAAHVLCRGTDGTSAARLYELIQRQTLRLVRLVDELLDVARITRGTIDLKRELVDLVDIARNAAAAMQARVAERRHTLVLNLPSDEVCVSGDPMRLEQVLANLLENAVKYTAPGGRIELTLAENDGQAVLTVSDNGLGLSPDMLEVIFELFRQGEQTLARANGGLGIGLSLVRRVLELHGGRVDAFSGGPGRGSDFVMRLPIVKGTKPAVATSSGSIAGQGVSRRILIVDDEEDAAESAATLLRSWSHEVAVAHDAPSALMMTENMHPEIVLVDIGLPGIDGYELARELRQRGGGGDVQLIALTGYGSDSDRKAAYAAGFDVHMVKPAHVETLQTIIGGNTRAGLQRIGGSPA